MVEEASCGWCGGVATLTCKGCGEVKYCGKDHQKKHWGKHKESCRPYDETQSDVGGRYLVASRKLPAGTLVIKEKPFVVGPAATSPLICLGCHKPVIEDSFDRCFNCSWPVCSQECPSMKNHEKECEVLSRDSKKCGVPVSQGDTPRYDIILVLRCLLLKEINPTSWQQILEMVSYAKQREEAAEPLHVATVKFLKDVCSVDFDVDTLHHVRGGVITNAINTTTSYGICLRGLYKTASRLNHSCVPNITLRSDTSGTLYIHTTVPVQKGEPLVFSYISPSNPIWQRQLELSAIYYFSCQCRRCLDPSELNTNMSSVRCSECSLAFLEPRDSSHSAWECPKCGNNKDLEAISGLAEKYLSLIEKNTSNVENASSFLREICSNLHAHHFVWIQAAQATLRNLRKDDTLPSLKLRRDIWRRLLEIFSVVEPGKSRRRGVSLLEMASVLLKEYQRGMTSNSPGTDTTTTDHWIQELTDVLSLLKESEDILQLEPPNSKELQILEGVRQEIKKTQAALASLKS